MQEVRIKKFATHYRLPQAMLSERRKLEQARTTVLEEALELALERAGVPEDGEVCIRQIYAPVRLRVPRSEAEIAIQWSLNLAAEIERAIRDGRATNVVIYSSRRQALLDATLHVARGDFRRAWAWRQLGFWRVGDQPGESEALDVLVQALITDGTIVLPALHALLDAGLLINLTRRLSNEQWETLAQAAIAESALVPLEVKVEPSPRSVAEAMRILKSSRLFPVLATSQSFSQGAVAHAIAALVVLDEEPALLHTNHAAAVIELIADAIVRSEANNDWADTPASEAASVSSDAFRTLPVEGAAVESAPLDLRQRAATQFGGLLFLLSVIDDLNLPDELLVQLGTRSLRWTLHQLALTLLAVEADDAAALALAGLCPGATPPSLRQEAATERETRALQAFGVRILKRLRLLLDWEGSDASLLTFVCARPADIIADPGWIEVRFSLEAVATEIRRAGLDLDPGYLSWLGVVVKFVYA